MHARHTLTTTKTKKPNNQVRELLDSEGAPRVKIVAQIDTPSAIRNYDELLRVSDAIMVSRTNLGMVIKPEKVQRVLFVSWGADAQSAQPYV